MRILSKKYNGSLRSENHPAHYRTDSGFVEVYSAPGSPYLYHKTNAWRKNENGLIEMFFSDRWYNVMHIFEHESHDYAMYINLALPAEISGEEVVWVDMDLDYRVGLDGRIELIDEDEFEENKLEQSYPSEIIDQVLAASELLPELIKRAAFPFNYSEQESRYNEWIATHRKSPSL